MQPISNKEHDPQRILLLADIVRMMRKLLEFPYPHICRHSVALDLLSILEEQGLEVADDLARAICGGSPHDEEALSLLASLDKQLSVDKIALSD